MKVFTKNPKQSLSLFFELFYVYAQAAIPQNEMSDCNNAQKYTAMKSTEKT